MVNLFCLLDAHLAGFARRLDERGASAVEYGLLITGIAALIAVVVFLFGGSVAGLFSNTCSTLSSTRASGSCG